MSALGLHPLAQALGWALLHFLWQGALVGLLVALGLRLLRARTAQARYLFACGGFLLMALLPVATFTLQAKVAVVPAVLELTRPVGPWLTVAAPPSLLNQVQAQWPARAALTAWLPWALGLWLLGVSLLTLRMVGAWFWLQGLKLRQTVPASAEWHLRLSTLQRRLGIHQTVELLKSATLEVPMVIGWFRPVILVPTAAFLGMEAQALEAVLAHELAHIRRHDYLVNLLQTVIEILLFYHPAVWWLSAQLRTERENCCDDVAVAYCGDAVAYAKALATLEGLRQPALFRTELALAADGGSLMHRIRRLLLPSLPPSPTRKVGLLAMLAVSALGAGTLLHLKAEGSQPKVAGAPEEKRVTTIAVSDGHRKFRATLRGHVELRPDTPELLTLSDGASLELRTSGEGLSRTFKAEKGAQGETRTYQEDGQTKPFDAAAQAWVKEGLKEVQKAQKKSPATPAQPHEGAGPTTADRPSEPSAKQGRVLELDREKDHPGAKRVIVEIDKSSEGGARTSKPQVQVTVLEDGGQRIEKRIVIDTDNISKEVERHLGEVERQQGEMQRGKLEMRRDQGERRRAKAEVLRELHELGPLSDRLKRHKTVIIKRAEHEPADLDLDMDLGGDVDEVALGAHIVAKRTHRGPGAKQEAAVLRSAIAKLQARLEGLEAAEEAPGAPPKPPRAPRLAKPPKPPEAPHAPLAAPAPPPPPPVPNPPRNP